MKSFSRLILSIILVFFMANGLAGENEYEAKGREELYGTWLLVYYKSGTPPRRVTIKPGSYDGFYPASESGKTIEQINSQWEYPREMDISNDNYRKYRRK